MKYSLAVTALLMSAVSQVGAQDQSVEDIQAAAIAQAQEEAQKLIVEIQAQAAIQAQLDEDSQQWDYALNGANWGTDFPGECDQQNQSPIDLPSEGVPYYKDSKDNINKIYSNLAGNITVEWAYGSTTKVAINQTGQPTQIFSSLYSPLVLGGDSRFTGLQFEFHTGSEHTVDGMRHDLEMDVLHSANTVANDIASSNVGILFSVNDFNAVLNPIEIAIIDNFFSSLNLESEETNPIVQEIAFGDLMDMFDTTSRWVYSGSDTTPPCARTVYWNILKTIYPIKEKHLNLFKKQTELQTEYDLKNIGNWRVINELTYEHNLQQIVRPEVYNQLIEELIREYLLYNGYTGTLNSMFDESISVSETVSLTRIDMIDVADITVTSQSSPLIYDLAMRDSEVEQVYVPKTEDVAAN